MQGPKWRQLIDVVRSHSLLRGTRIKLASGAESSFYFNMKPTLFAPAGAAVVAECMLDQLYQDGAELIGGLEMGAVPIVGDVVLLSHLHGEGGVQGFFVRKVPKDHGTRKLIEGIADHVPLEGSER